MSAFLFIEVIGSNKTIHACIYPEINPVAPALRQLFNAICFSALHDFKKLPNGRNNCLHKLYTLGENSGNA